MFGFENPKIYFQHHVLKNLVNHILSLVFANILSKTLDEHGLYSGSRFIRAMKSMYHKTIEEIE